MAYDNICKASSKSDPYREGIIREQLERERELIENLEKVLDELENKLETVLMEETKEMEGENKSPAERTPLASEMGHSRSKLQKAVTRLQKLHNRISI